mmetsp:Transcript_3973/g.5793  ORF Transcript_3973/g.5793 Transcript_3973/m.5793 type:complete len:397 (+) Transcript_3973:343-1533(+)
MEDECDRRLSLYALIARTSGRLKADPRLERFERLFDDETLPNDKMLFGKIMKKNAFAYVGVKGVLKLKTQVAATEKEIVSAIANKWRLFRNGEIDEEPLLELAPNKLQVRRTRNFGEKPRTLQEEQAESKRLAHCVRVTKLRAMIKDLRSKKDIGVADIKLYFEELMNKGGNGRKKIVKKVKLIKGGKAKTGKMLPDAAVVEFFTPRQANEAIKIHQTKLDVKVVRERPSKPEDAKPVKQKRSESDEEAPLRAESPDNVGGKAEKKNVEQIGTVRTIDLSSFEGFIAPLVNSTDSNSKKRKKQKAIHFDLRDNQELFGQLRVGAKVSYSVTKGSAVDIVLVPNNNDGPAGKDTRSPGRRIGNSGPGDQKNYAIGPPNASSSYKGFGSKEWRYLRRC